MSLFGIGRRYYRPFKRVNGYHFRFRSRGGVLRYTGYGRKYRKYVVKKGF